MNLIVCTTPLQCLIAERIQNNYARSPFELVYFAERENKVVKHYYKRLAAQAEKSHFIHGSFSLSNVMLIKRLLRKETYDTVFVSSVDNRLIHYVLSNITFSKINTFDDGTANINSRSSFYRAVKARPMIGVLHYLLGRKYTLNDVVRKSALHYTIYQDRPNIVPHTQYIDLLLKNKNSVFDKGEVNLFIGTVYEELTRNHFSAIKDRVTELLLSRDFYYIPHPRENYTPDTALKKLESDCLLAEEHILNFLNAGYRVNIYGFFSTVQFNMYGQPGVTAKYIYSDCLMESYKALRHLVDNENILNLDEIQ